MLESLPSFPYDLDTYGLLVPKNMSMDMSCSHNRNRVVSDPTIAGMICWANETTAARLKEAESEQRRLRRKARQEAAADRERGEEELEEFHDAVTHEPQLATTTTTTGFPPRRGIHGEERLKRDGERVRREVMGAMLVSITSPTPRCSSSSSSSSSSPSTPSSPDADSFSCSPSPISVYNHTPYNSPSQNCDDMHMFGCSSSVKLHPLPLRKQQKQKSKSKPSRSSSRKNKERDLNLVRPPPQNPAKLMVPFAPEEGMEEDDYQYLLLARRLAQEALEFDAASVNGDQFPDPDPYSTDEDEDGDGNCISFTESVFNRQFYKLRQLEKGGAGSYSGDDEEDNGDEDWVNDTFDQWLGGGSSSSSCQDQQDEGGFCDNYSDDGSGYEGGDDRSLFLDHHEQQPSSFLGDEQSFLGDLEEEEEDKEEDGEVEVFPFSPPPTQTTFGVL
ncbi:hypothetical protein QBC46DRAFT_406355 [Diplogelasinospora grovesii]|uniref:Transcription factor Iwr1 domain-containing protein n=1 Tax=Diplogelasinospora grovesii TaxID=303347 RepID=A0AAN6S6N1_9PEZI|nr:hypothetical protein QBC46DRAFT_406355 [Diplogelasinospora grovesii]